MNCERCLSRRAAGKYAVDGYSGFLCDRCREEWERLLPDRHGLTRTPRF
ncbi:MAG: hypothetical protein ABEH47_08175 [Haloferacaceae archaeon]